MECDIWTSAVKDRHLFFKIGLLNDYQVHVIYGDTVKDWATFADKLDLREENGDLMLKKTFETYADYAFEDGLAATCFSSGRTSVMLFRKGFTRSEDIVHEAVHVMQELRGFGIKDDEFEAYATQAIFRKARAFLDAVEEDIRNGTDGTARTD